MPKLGEILEQVSRSEPVDLTKEYHLLGIRLEGGGAFHRETKLGSQVSANIFFKVKSGDFIYSRLFAWRGAFDVIDNSLDSFYVSNEFPTFIHQQDKVDAEFLRLWFRLPGTIAKVEALCSGSTPLTRNRLKEGKFLNLEVPLPPLEEQSRIVARIEELAAKIEEARGLRREAVEEASKLVEELEFQLWPDEDIKSNARSLEEITVFLSRGRYSEQGYSNHYLIKTQHVQLGKYIRSQLMLESEIADRVQPEAIVKKGDVLIACSAAGCLGRVSQFMEDQLASTDTHVAIARANTRVILPGYLYAYLKGAQGQIQLRSRERGDWTREKVGFRLTELNLADLKRVPVPLPSIPEQRKMLERLEDLQSKLNAIKDNQSVTSAQLNALLPSILDKAFKGEL